MSSLYKRPSTLRFDYDKYFNKIQEIRQREMIIATEKDCKCKYSKVSKTNPERCLICKGYINYRLGI